MVMPATGREIPFARILHVRNAYGPTFSADGRTIAFLCYGGFMVISCLTKYPETWAAGVEFDGIANFLSFFEHMAPWRRSWIGICSR